MRQVTMCLIAAGLVACSSGTNEGRAEEQELPGDYSEIIASEDDCTELQAIFDTADQSNMDAKADVMAATDDRMSEVGCYDD